MASPPLLRGRRRALAACALAALAVGCVLLTAGLEGDPLVSDEQLKVSHVPWTRPWEAAKKPQHRDAAPAAGLAGIHFIPVQPSPKLPAATKTVSKAPAPARAQAQEPVHPDKRTPVTAAVQEPVVKAAKKAAKKGAKKAAIKAVKAVKKTVKKAAKKAAAKKPDYTAMLCTCAQPKTVPCAFNDPTGECRSAVMLMHPSPEACVQEGTKRGLERCRMDKDVPKGDHTLHFTLHAFETPQASEKSRHLQRSLVETNTVAQQLYGRKWALAHAKQLAEATMHRGHQPAMSATQQSAARVKALNAVRAAEKLRRNKKARALAKWKEARTKNNIRDQVALEEEEKKRQAWWNKLTNDYNHKNDKAMAKKKAEEQAKLAKETAKNNAEAESWATQVGDRIANNLNRLKQSGDDEDQAEQKKMQAAKELDALRAKLNQKKVLKVQKEMKAVHQQFVDALKNAREKRQRKAKEMNGKAEAAERLEEHARVEREREEAARAEQEQQMEMAAAKAEQEMQTGQAMKQEQQQQMPESPEKTPPPSTEGHMGVTPYGDELDTALHTTPALSNKMLQNLKSLGRATVSSAAMATQPDVVVERVSATAIAQAQREEQQAEARLQHDQDVKARAMQQDIDAMKAMRTHSEEPAAQEQQRTPDSTDSKKTRGADPVAEARRQEQLAEERLERDQQMNALAVKQDTKLRRAMHKKPIGASVPAMQGGFEDDHDACRSDCERLRRREQEEAREAAAQPHAQHTQPAQTDLMEVVADFDSLVEARNSEGRRLLQAVGSQCDCAAFTYE